MMKKIYNRYEKWAPYKDTYKRLSVAKEGKGKPLASGWSAADGFVQHDVRQRCERWKE